MLSELSINVLASVSELSGFEIELTDEAVNLLVIKYADKVLLWDFDPDCCQMLGYYLDSANLNYGDLYERADMKERFRLETRNERTRDRLRKNADLLNKKWKVY